MKKSWRKAFLAEEIGDELVVTQFLGGVNSCNNTKADFST